MNETQEEHLFTSEQKIEWWGFGEWVEEQDFIHFYYLNYECIIRRCAIQEPHSVKFHMFGGHLCGYVRIPPDHPYHHKIYEDMEIDCHGGLTWGEVSNGHWIGFDCAHSGDYCPSTEHYKKTDPAIVRIKEMFPLPKGFEEYAIFNPVYRNIEYCTEQCRSIVEQLRALDCNLIKKIIEESNDNS